MVSKTCGIASHVEQSGGGWVVLPEVSSIKDGLCRVMQDRKKWEFMGKLNHSYVVKNMTWDQVAQQTMELYQKCFQ